MPPEAVQTTPSLTKEGDLPFTWYQEVLSLVDTRFQFVSRESLLGTHPFENYHHGHFLDGMGRSF